MKNLSLRWRIKGKLKVVFIVVFTISIIFITYQFLNYATLDQYQADESAAHFRHHLQKQEIPVKIAVKPGSDKKESFLDVVKIPQVVPSRGKPLAGFVIGVAPEYQKYYSKQTNKFSCLSLKSRKISWDKVNDDYCDCPIDGSDEPSTSACMNGRFYCNVSSQTYPEYIPSSRVNDGICDCCDGADEYMSPDLCRFACK